ncbi:MAG: hydroxymethylbilane synthase [Lachnospiraceae bacterium]
MRQVRIGTRESKLALIQTEMVAEYIRTNTDREPVLVPMKTTGDRILDRRLDQIGGKGLFVKELDAALLEKRSDLSVHSLKDVPMEVPKELPLIGFSKREDPRDVLVLPEGVDSLDSSKPLGSSSLRRQLQVKKLYPQMKVKSVRGNVLTRLKKLDDGEYSGLILSAAGLKRLGLEERISRYFSVEEIIPASGQGILALQGRSGETYSFLEGFLDEAATAEAMAERAFTKTLNGGCSAPIAAHAQVDGDTLSLCGMYAKAGDTTYRTASIFGSVEDAEMLGIQLAKKIKGEANG